MESIKKKISPFILAMITITLIVSLRGFPFLAVYGLGSIFFYLFSAIFFLIPLALISAELATTWPEKGGIFLWVSKAFGNRLGFVATFLEWMESIIWYPTALSFIAMCLSYLIDPNLAENKYYALSVVLIIYWAATYINFKGLRVSGLVSTFAMILGTFLPALIIIISCISWLIGGHNSQISFSWHGIIPDFSNWENLSFLAGTFLAFAGIEVSAVHVNEMENPKKEYPKAIFLAISIILFICVFGTLSIATVIPKGEISVIAGVMQAFSNFFTELNIQFLIPIMAGLISFGTLGQILSWIIGPSKAMLESAKRKDLPSWFAKTNKNNIPVNILLTQGLIVSFLSSIFLLMPSVSSSFWMLSILAILDYMLMYFLLYASALWLRIKEPNINRPFKVPGNKWGIWVISFFGIIALFMVYCLSFMPPLFFPKEKILFFDLFLIIGIIILISIPLVIYSFKDKWK